MPTLAHPPQGLRRRDLGGLLGLVLPGALMLAGCAAPRPTGFVDLIRRTSPAVVGIGDDRGVIGSGFRLAGTRRIVSAAHVVAAARGALAIAWQDRRWPARLLRVDAEQDLALLEVADDLPMPGLVLWAGAASEPGEWIVVLGRPFGARATATVGIVSAEPGAVKEPAFLRARLQLNAAVNPGNSGGPVLNLDGQVIGVVSAAVPGGSGLGFAVPAAAVAAFVGTPG